MSTLSGSLSKTAPGLPRGRTRLDPVDATAQQRERLLRAVISAVAEKGYQATTIADVVERARVSRSVMYREFDGKLDCFLAAIEAGRTLVAARMTDAMAAASGGGLEAVLRAIIQAYLHTCAAETDHTRAWVLELAAAGPEGIESRDRYLDGFAAMLRDIDRAHGSGRSRSPEHYTALVGGLTELVSREVRAGAQAALPQLEDAMTSVAVTMLR